MHFLGIDGNEVGASHGGRYGPAVAGFNGRRRCRSLGNLPIGANGCTHPGVRHFALGSGAASR
jgi:hypothetical protein